MKKTLSVLITISLLGNLLVPVVSASTSAEAQVDKQEASSSAQPVASDSAQQSASGAVQLSPSDSLDNPFADTSIDGQDTSSSFPQSLLQSLSETPLFSSAFIRQMAAFRALTHKTFRSDEDVTMEVTNATAGELRAQVLDKTGKTVAVGVDKTTTNDVTTLSIHPFHQFTPGKFTLKVTDSTGQVLTQDFTWGVLAINTNKSMYLPGETADIAMAVLDEAGKVVCDADVRLEITNPKGAKNILSTEGKSITVNPSCVEHKADQKPDYEATYTVGKAGTYQMTLTAKTKNGSYTISDNFSVHNFLPFEIERTSATRLYPDNIYDMTFRLKANQDFTGTVTEEVPASFSISQSQDSMSYDSIKEETVADTQTIPINLHVPFEGKAKITQGFGDSLTDPEEKALYQKFGLKGHDGLDFDVAMDTPVLAVDAGTVVLAGEGAYGTTVVIQHSWGRSYYGHLESVDVSVGQKVSVAQVLGHSGNSGLSTGAHLHFGIKPLDADMNNGYFGKVDPTPYLASVLSDGESNNVLGISNVVQSDGVKTISWKVSVNKGDTITFGYAYQPPHISPQFFTAGPLKFANTDGQTIFSEARAWQMANDTTNVTIEQQINIIDQQYGTANSTDSPTDNSLGMILWNSTKYSNISAVYFEAVIENSSSGTATTATLYSSAGSAVTGSAVTTTNASFTRVRTSSSILSNLTDNTTYTVRINTATATSTTATILAARLIIVQSSATNLTKTETQVELGSNTSSTSTTATSMSAPKYFTYNRSNYDSGSITATFTATVKVVNSSIAGTAGPNGAAASSNCVDATGNGGTVTWTSPGNVFSSNSTFATASVDGTTTHYIECTTYGFSIPSNATIQGITVGVTRKSSSTNNGGIQDANVRLVKGGTIGTTDRATTTVWPTTSTEEDHGNAGDLWGDTWTPSDINNTGFGAVVAAKKASAAGAAQTASVDYISITVAYSTPVIGTAKALLCDITATASTCDSSPAASLTSASTTWTSPTPVSATLTTGTTYEVRIETSDASVFAEITNAQVILDQSVGGGITKLETYHQYINANEATASTGVSYGFKNLYEASNWSGGTITYYHEASIEAVSGSGTADLTPGTLGSITNSSTTAYALVRSSAVTPVDTTEYDTELSTARADNSWLVIDVTGLQTGGGGTVTPTLDQLMRHGKWFNNGSLQPFTF